MVIVQFFFLVVSYFGGEEKLLSTLEGQEMKRSACSKCCTCEGCKQHFSRQALNIDIGNDFKSLPATHLRCISRMKAPSSCFWCVCLSTTKGDMRGDILKITFPATWQWKSNNSLWPLVDTNPILNCSISAKLRYFSRRFSLLDLHIFPEFENAKISKTAKLPSWPFDFISVDWRLFTCTGGSFTGCGFLYCSTPSLYLSSDSWPTSVQPMVLRNSNWVFKRRESEVNVYSKNEQRCFSAYAIFNLGKKLAGLC